MTQLNRTYLWTKACVDIQDTDSDTILTWVLPSELDGVTTVHRRRHTTEQLIHEEIPVWCGHRIETRPASFILFYKLIEKQRLEISTKLLFSSIFPVSHIGHITKKEIISITKCVCERQANWSYQSLQSCPPTQFLLHARIQHLANSTRCHGAPLWRSFSHADPGRRKPPCVFVS